MESQMSEAKFTTTLKKDKEVKFKDLKRSKY